MPNIPIYLNDEEYITFKKKEKEMREKIKKFIQEELGK